jgi:hypothetical protein
MGSLHGPFKFNGKLGNVVGYELNGEPVVRMIGSTDKTSEHPHVQQVRTEFKHVSMDNKFFRNLLAPFLKELCRKQLNNDIQPLFSSIRDMDVLPKGNRTVGGGLAVPGAIDLVKGFEFNASPAWIRYILRAEPEIDRESQSLSLHAFVPSYGLKVPHGASHCFLSSCILRVDFSELSGEISESNRVSVRLSNGDSQTIALLPERKLTGTGAYLLLLKVVYYEHVNGIDYLLSGSGNGCMVVDGWMTG